MLCNTVDLTLANLSVSNLSNSLFYTEMLGMLGILMVSCALIEALRHHCLAMDVCNAVRVGLEVGLIGASISVEFGV